MQPQMLDSFLCLRYSPHCVRRHMHMSPGCERMRFHRVIKSQQKDFVTVAGRNGVAPFASRAGGVSQGRTDFEVGPRHVFEPIEGRPEIEIGSHQRRLPLSLDRPCSLPPSLAQIRCWMIGRTTPRPRYGSRQRPRPVMKIMPYLGMSSRHGLCQLHLEYPKMIRPSINSDRRGIFVEYFEVAWLLQYMVMTAV